MYCLCSCTAFVTEREKPTKPKNLLFKVNLDVKFSDPCSIEITVGNEHFPMTDNQHLKTDVHVHTVTQVRLTW